LEFFLVLTFLFAVGALCGWVIELFFRRFAHGKWINPGFLHGPYLPLYGFGLVLLFLIARIPLDGISSTWLRIVTQLVIICIVMTFIEYLSGLIFIKGMGIKLWDYSDRWGNIQGIICPLFSLFWTIVGGAYVFLLDPLIYRAVSWFTNNLYYSFFVGIFFGLFFWDLASTLKLSAKIRKFAKENQISVRYEELKVMLKNALAKEKIKSSFINPFKASTETFKATLSKYLENFKNGEYTFSRKKKQDQSNTDKKAE
jgi:uncharacterized membrane protein